MSAPLPTNRGTFSVAMSRTVLVHTVLASLALVVAYMTWTSGDRPDRPQEEVTVLECAASDLRSVTLTSKRRTVKIEWRRDGGERAAWVTVGGERPARGAAPAAKRFAGNEALDRWLEENMPLRALRSLGDVDRARLTELELATPDTKLDIDCGSRRASYRLGGSAYGTGERYARATSGGPVYLFGAGVVSDLESAESRFMQRELHRFTAADIDKIRVETAGRTRTLLQRNRRTPAQAAWVDEAAPGQRNELYGNWLDRVAALRVTEFLPTGREPGSELAGGAGGRQVTPVATLRYEADGREKGTLTLVRIETAGAPTYYARSEVTHGWVKVLGSVATQVEQDARPVVGLDPIAPPPEPPAQRPSPAAGGSDGSVAPRPDAGRPGLPGTGTRPTTPRLPVPEPGHPDVH